MGKGGGSPPPRNLSDEFGQIADSSGIIFDQERQMGQQLGQDQLGQDQDYVNQLTKTDYPQLSEAERLATHLQRGAVGDLGDVRAFGAKYTRALDTINPEWQSSLGRLNAAAQDASGGPTPLLGRLNDTANMGLDVAQNLGPSQLRLGLEQQAQNDLALGRSLSPEQVRDATQASRAAYASRGITDSNPALIGEVMNRDQYASQLEAQRRAFAGQTQQLAQSEDQSLTQRALQLGGFGQSVEGMNEAQQTQNFNLQNSAFAANQNAMSPVLGFFGNRAAVSPMGAAQVMSSAPNIINAGATAMQPLLNYGQDLFNTNFNAQAAAMNSSANSAGSEAGAGIGAIGKIAGTVLPIVASAFCWVAREIYGTEECELGKKWQVVREWMIHHAPEWLFRLYCQRGPGFAAWLHERSVPANLARIVVRGSMERLIAGALKRRHQQLARRWETVKAC